MSYVESVTILRKEYEEKSSDRVHEAEFMVDGLFTMMMTLKANREGYEAAKMPARVKTLQQTEAGIYLATVSILNTDLNDTVTYQGQFSDGYGKESKSNIVINDIPITECYLKQYGDEIDDGLQEIIDKVLLPA